MLIRLDNHSTCPPTSYETGWSFSLVVAFEDPDGGKAKALLMERYLYAFNFVLEAHWLRGGDTPNGHYVNTGMYI
jgi:hypothetical protein